MSLTFNLIGCFVCFVWGASEEGLALRLIGFLEYTPLPLSLSSFLTPLPPSILHHSLHSSIFLFSHKPLFVYLYLTSSSNGLLSPFTQCLSRFQVCINTFWMPHWLEQGLFSLTNTPEWSPPPCRKRVVTLFPGLPPAEPLPLTRNIQLIYPWLLGGLWSCVPIGSIWEQCREVIYNNHFQWLIIPRPNNPKTQFPTALFIKVTDGQNLEKLSYNR